MMTINAKQRRTLVALFTKPTRSGIVFSDIEALLRALGCELHVGGGSRIGFTLRGQRIHLHRPHPGKEARRYQVEELRAFLERLGIEP
jgi:hypothetical protein